MILSIMFSMTLNAMTQLNARLSHVSTILAGDRSLINLDWPWAVLGISILVSGCYLFRRYLNHNSRGFTVSVDKTELMPGDELNVDVEYVHMKRKPLKVSSGDVALIRVETYSGSRGRSLEYHKIVAKENLVINEIVDSSRSYSVNLHIPSGELPSLKSTNKMGKIALGISWKVLASLEVPRINITAQNEISVLKSVTPPDGFGCSIAGNVSDNASALSDSADNSVWVSNVVRKDGYAMTLYLQRNGAISNDIMFASNGLVFRSNEVVEGVISVAAEDKDVKVEGVVIELIRGERFGNYVDDSVFQDYIVCG